MDEQQVRALVRQAIARHMGPAGGAASAPSSPAAESRRPAVPMFAPAVVESGSIAGARFHLARPETEVECLIEPAVMCNHCGYCQCYGH